MEQNRKPLTYEDIANALAKLPKCPPRRLVIYKDNYIDYRYILDKIPHDEIELMVLLENNIDVFDVKFSNYFLLEGYDFEKGHPCFKVYPIHVLTNVLKPYINELQTQEEAPGGHQDTEEP